MSILIYTLIAVAIAMYAAIAFGLFVYKLETKKLDLEKYKHDNEMAFRREELEKAYAVPEVSDEVKKFLEETEKEDKMMEDLTTDLGTIAHDFLSEGELDEYDD